jgi:hypothetical protein
LDRPKSHYFFAAREKIPAFLVHLLIVVQKKTGGSTNPHGDAASQFG